jgi:hypothetical protein
MPHTRLAIETGTAGNVHHLKGRPTVVSISQSNPLFIPVVLFAIQFSQKLTSLLYYFPSRELCIQDSANTLS